EWTNGDSDNDGLWTSMYGAGECFAYAATKDPKAKERATNPDRPSPRRNMRYPPSCVVMISVTNEFTSVRLSEFASFRTLPAIDSIVRLMRS
ncbi:MAG: hypothetical protein MUO70_02185, partial [Euryarchaeota archaeon]|nr:hypothetical protein [Euryarchaeota archaeon]